MRTTVFVAAIFAILTMETAAGQSCRISSVDPGSGKTGDTVGVTGESIDKAKVDELFLTDGTKDFKVEMLEQSDSAIKFKIPKMKAGRYSLMLKTKGPDVKLLEQPVRFTVEE
jgi:hypothetical protein